MSVPIVKVFSATKFEERARLGDVVTEWMRARRESNAFEVDEIRTHQSSDEAFHCLSIVVIGKEELPQNLRRLSFKEKA